MLVAAEWSAKSDTGRQRRDNEDDCYARAPVFAVADGMGGAQAGEVASRIAIEAIEQGLPEAGTPEERLSSRFQAANHRIHELSRTQRERAGMGTTLTAAYVDDGGIAIAHVGDSRAYLFREGALSKLTEDHSLVAELVRQEKLTEEQAAEHPQRSIITRALGPEPTVEVDTWTYGARGGDVILLCSDGLTSMISEAAIADILASTPGLAQAAEALIDRANEAGGRDNITVVLFRLEEVEGPGADEPRTLAEVPAGDTQAPTEPHHIPDEISGGGPRAAAGEPPEPHPPPDQDPDEAGELDRTLAPASARSRSASGVAVAEPAVRLPLARTQGRPGPAREKRRPRHAKPLAALISLVIVLCLIGGGGYLATRALYFVSTNSQGIVTIYRGMPYDLPFGIHLYETFYVSGVPASLVPPDRRKAVFNHQLRSETDASTLVRQLELGQLSK